MPHPPIAEQITFLYTADLASTADFYENTFGLKLWLDQGTCRIYQVNDHAFLGFCEREEVQKEHRDVIFTIVTPKLSDVDKWYEYLKGQNVHFENPPAENCKYAIYHWFLRDPNGYLIEIQHFLNQ